MSVILSNETKTNLCRLIINTDTYRDTYGAKAVKLTCKYRR